MDAGLLSGLANALTLANIGFALIGCLLGTLVGMLPGLGPLRHGHPAAGRALPAPTGAIIIWPACASAPCTADPPPPS